MSWPSRRNGALGAGIDLAIGGGTGVSAGDLNSTDDDLAGEDFGVDADVAVGVEPEIVVDGADGRRNSCQVK